MSEESEYDWEPYEDNVFEKEESRKKGKTFETTRMDDKIEDPKRFKRVKYPDQRTYDDEEEGVMVNVGGLWDENITHFPDGENNRRKQRRKSKRNK